MLITEQDFFLSDTCKIYLFNKLYFKEQLFALINPAEDLPRAHAMIDFIDLSQLTKTFSQKYAHTNTLV